MTTQYKRTKARELLRKGRNAKIVPVADLGATYMRLGGGNDTPIRYHRIGARRPIRTLDANARTAIIRLVYMVSMLPPNAVDEILRLPSQQLGHLVKAALRRALNTNGTRGFFRRRPASRVFRGVGKLFESEKEMT